jgi:hypothetical protein
METSKKQARVREFILFAAILLSLTALLFALIRTILAGYGVAWTGFGGYELPGSDYVPGKTLWDWMDLLIIPLFLAVGAFYLERSERTVERKVSNDRERMQRTAAEERAKLEHDIATGRQQEAALQAYLDRMAELLLKEKLREAPNEEAWNVARVRTLTVLRGLNASRNGIVLRFLRDIELVGTQESRLFIAANLEGADLKGVNLNDTNLEAARLEGADLEKAFLISANLESAILRNSNLACAHLGKAHLNRAVLSDSKLRNAGLYYTDLRNTNLKDANLEGADLRNSNLQNANMENAILKGADLRGANLQGAFLRNANLETAQVSDEQLATVKSLEGATRSDVTRHE